MAKKEVGFIEKHLWRFVIAQGVLSILFGIVALFWPGLTVALFILLFGIFILIWGIVGVIASLTSIEREKFWWLELVFSLFIIGLATFVLRNPVTTAAFFITVIGLTFIVRGLVDVLEAFFDKTDNKDRRVFSGISGVLGIVAGIITLSYPISAGVAVVWVIGLYAVLYGTLLLAFSFKVQNELQK